MAIEKIAVPDLGEATDVEVIELLVTVGQQVAENDSLLVLESDKAAMEIPAPVAGVQWEINMLFGLFGKAAGRARPPLGVGVQCMTTPNGLGRLYRPTQYFGEDRERHPIDLLLFVIPVYNRSC